MQPHYLSDLPRQLNEMRRQLLQHDVDLKRLWNQLAPQGQGWPVGGDGTGAPLVGPWSPYESSGGGSSCAAQNAKHLVTLIGPPTGGTWKLTYTVNGTTTLLGSLNYNATASDVQSAIEAHAEVGSGNVTVTGGNANVANFVIEFVGTLAETPIDPPLVSYGTLTGGGAGGLAYSTQIGMAA